MYRYSLRGRARKAYTLMRALLERDARVAELDMVRFREIEARYREAAPAPGPSKYLDVRYWLRVSLERVYLLGLHRKPQKRVFDLGTGAGYFPYLCARYGHDARALDLPDNPMFNELTELLGVRRVIARIDAQKPVPSDGRRYDWVTAFMVRFHSGWDRADWDYFLDDVRSRLLTDRGRICLGFNKNVSQFPEAFQSLLARGADTCEHIAILPRG